MPREKRLLNTPPFSIGTLVVVTLVAGVLLGGTNALTAGRIAAIKKAEREKMFREALGGVDRLESKMVTDGKGTFESVAGFKGSELVGRDYLVETPGYGGPIQAVVSVDPQGNVFKVMVLSQTETPGLGTKSSSPQFLSQFAGKKLGDTSLQLKKLGGDIDAVTGATISSRAVLTAVRSALELDARRAAGQ